MEETNTAVADSKVDSKPDSKPEERATQLAPKDGEARYQRKVAFLGNKRAKWAIGLVVLVLLVAGLFAWHYFGSYESTDDAAPAAAPNR